MDNPIDNMMQEVYTALLTQYQASTGSTSSLLAFEPMGMPISNAMFMLPGTGTVSNDMAVEQVSELANFLPSIANGMLATSDRTVDGFYGLLMDAQPGLGTDPDSFAVAKAAAKQLFEPTLNTFELPNYPYHPIFSTPPDWYDLSNTQNWTTYSSSQGDSAAGNAPPPVTAVPPALPPVHWRIPAPPAVPPPAVLPVGVPRTISFRPQLSQNVMFARLPESTSVQTTAVL